MIGWRHFCAGLVMLAIASVSYAQSRRFMVYDGYKYPPEQLPAISKRPAAYAPPSYISKTNSYWIPRAPDGHFYLPGNINGHPVSFLVDTGASSTVIPVRVARNAGIRAAVQVPVETASGKTTAGASEGNLLTLGVFSLADVKILVQEGLTTPLLGMDVLSGFSISHNNGAMTLRPNR